MEGRAKEASSSITVTEAEFTKTIDTFAATYMQKLADAQRQIDTAREDLAKVENRLTFTVIRSPINGIVQVSALTTSGQIVQSAAELMRVVPTNSQLEIEAYLPNRDIGFVAAGQRAVIKIEAFPFTRFGTIEAEVTSIATDAIPSPTRNSSSRQLPRSCNQSCRPAMCSACRTWCFH